MSEIKESNTPEKKDVTQTELGKAADKIGVAPSEISNASEDSEQLTDDELNEPIDELLNGERASLDCRSECKYNTGDRSKYSNYGYSD